MRSRRRDASNRCRGKAPLEAVERQPQRRQRLTKMPVQEIKLKAASDAPSKSGLENVPPDQLERAMKAAMARNDSELDLSEEE